MINNATITDLYTTFATAPQLFEDRGIGRLMDYAFDTDAVDFDGDSIVFNTMDAESPMRSIEIENIWGVKEFPLWMAVVLPNSIIFLNRADFTTRVHLKGE